jgi:hypothetical protein
MCCEGKVSRTLMSHILYFMLEAAVLIVDSAWQVGMRGHGQGKTELTRSWSHTSGNQIFFMLWSNEVIQVWSSL